MASNILRASPAVIRRNKIKTFFSKPHNVSLILVGIVLTITTVAPIVAIVEDTFKIHPGTIDAHLTGQTSGYTLVNYIDLFTSNLAKTNLWEPLWNTVLLAVGTCVVSILFGGLFAFLITRTNLAWRKYLSSIFIFPYIMPQWTLAVVWQHMFNSNAVTGTSNGLLAATLGIEMPAWWCLGIFHSVVVLGLHYAPFAYILIGGIFRNMDANLEEAATILDTPKWKIMFRVTLPMVKPAILSTILLVFAEQHAGQQAGFPDTGPAGAEVFQQRFGNDAPEQEFLRHAHHCHAGQKAQDTPRREQRRVRPLKDQCAVYAVADECQRVHPHQQTVPKAAAAAAQQSLPPGAAQQQPGRPCPHQLLYKAEKVFIQTGKICPGRHQRDGQHQTGQKQGAEEQYLGKDAIQNGVSCAQTFEHESASCVT